MPKLNVLNINGQNVGEIELVDSIFNVEVNEHVLYEVVKNQLANKRQGTQSAKTRAEVRGGGRKPWKQKGTGRARQGTIRAPHMVGGGVVFGPSPRSYEKKVNKKTRVLALKSALSAKVAAGEIVVLDGVMETPKTKTIVALTKALEANTKQMFVVNDLTAQGDYNLFLSARNLENAVVFQPNELGIYWLLKQNKVIITKEALATIEEVLG